MEANEAISTSTRATVTKTDVSSELPIELRHLDSEEDVVPENKMKGTTSANERSRSSPPSLGGKGYSFQSGEIFVNSNGTSFPRPFSTSSLTTTAQNNRSHILSDLLYLLPASVGSWLKNRLSDSELGAAKEQEAPLISRSQSLFVSPNVTCTSNVSFGNDSGVPACLQISESPKVDNANEDRSNCSEKKKETARRRPVLTKQKKPVEIFDSYSEEDDMLMMFKDSAPKSTLISSLKERRRVYKQGSMNDYLLSCERLNEREHLKRSISKQASLTDDNVLSKHGVDEMNTDIGDAPSSAAELSEANRGEMSSVRNGLLRMWHSFRADCSKSLQMNLKNMDMANSIDNCSSESTSIVTCAASSDDNNESTGKHVADNKSKTSTPLCKESRNSPRTCNKDEFNFSFTKCCTEQDLPKDTAIKSHRLSFREEGSDSSKDNSLQSDTSVDSEDSCISVIYVPRPDAVKSPSTGTRHAECDAERKTSTSSSSSSEDRSDKSPKGVLPVPAEEKNMATAAKSEAVVPISTILANSPTSCPPSATPLVEINVSPKRCSIATMNSDVARKYLTSPTVKAEKVLAAAVIGLENDLSQQVDSTLVGGSKKGVNVDFSDSIGVLQGPRRIFQRSIPQFFSFDVFNPETDDIDSDSSSESSSDSAGSVISVGDPMWPAFQDRRQTILSSSADILVKPNQGNPANDRPSQKEAVHPIWPTAAVDNTMNVETPTTLPIKTGQSIESKCALVVADQEKAVDKCPTIDEVKTTCDQPIVTWDDDSETGFWVRNSTLIPVNECHEDENEIVDTFQNETLMSDGTTYQWKEKVKSSFSASTSSLDSSFSAPSFSSVRQSSSASAVSEIRKNSDDSARISTLPLIKPRRFQDITKVCSKASKASSVSEEELCSSLYNCSKLPLNKLIDRHVEGSSSVSTSQDSLPSDTGGTTTLHRYYHVFREGELDQLIERYVENLHIISSYYDHANWCIVAEKVHVWTI